MPEPVRVDFVEPDIVPPALLADVPVADVDVPVADVDGADVDAMAPLETSDTLGSVLVTSLSLTSFGPGIYSRA